MKQASGGCRAHLKPGGLHPRQRLQHLCPYSAEHCQQQLAAEQSGDWTRTALTVVKGLQQQQQQQEQWLGFVTVEAVAAAALAAVQEQPEGRLEMV